MHLNEGHHLFEYSKPFALLSKAVEATNGSKVLNSAKLPARIFEPAENRINKAQSDAFDVGLRPMLHTLNEIRTFFRENPDADF